MAQPLALFFRQTQRQGFLTDCGRQAQNGQTTGGWAYAAFRPVTVLTQVAQHIKHGFADLGTVTRAHFGACTRPACQGQVGGVLPLQNFTQGAGDLLQTALAKLYLSWGRVRDREAIDGYVRRILVNENNSLWRRAWKKREFSTDTLPDHQAVTDRPDDGQSAAVAFPMSTPPGGASDCSRDAVFTTSPIAV